MRMKLFYSFERGTLPGIFYFSVMEWLHGIINKKLVLKVNW